MEFVARLRSAVKGGRKRGSAWVRAFDLVRELPTAGGRARLWTGLTSRGLVHQAAADTWEERYPAIFDGAANLVPDAGRILSFGCSTGEELISLRRRFPNARIVGAEINGRSRRIAARRAAADAGIELVKPERIDGGFDLVFALGVFQRDPHWVEEAPLQDLSPHYPFDLFDRTVRDLVARLRGGGLLCVMYSQYLVDMPLLEPVPDSPTTPGPFFAPSGERLSRISAPAIYRKR